jgi:hypothetical protein
MPPFATTERFRLDLQRVPEEVFEPEAVADAPLVRFVAYFRHERLYGWVPLHADRLTDLLNAHEEISLVNAELEDLETGVVRAEDEVVVRVQDLVAVHASGPRGDQALRRRTRSHPVALQAGNYLVAGHLHVAPGVAAIDDLEARQFMVPLTDAWIEYWSGGSRTRHAIGTIIINRTQADWVRAVTDDDLLEGALRPGGGLPAGAELRPALDSAAGRP